MACESNLQLGCIWWKNGGQAYILFTHFVLTFVNFMSGHEIWDFSRFTCLTVDERRKMHFVTHIFMTDKNPKYSNINWPSRGIDDFWFYSGGPNWPGERGGVRISITVTDTFSWFTGGPNWRGGGGVGREYKDITNFVIRRVPSWLGGGGWGGISKCVTYTFSWFMGVPNWPGGGGRGGNTKTLHTLFGDSQGVTTDLLDV